MRKLYIVGTPIGNLKDITLRALEILKSVDVILAEDTRVSRKLLSHYGISKRVLRYIHGKDFSNYESVAFLTDAGTPGISDPGTALVRDLMEKDFEIIAVPGPSALAAAVSISDIELSDFIFFGFPPAKKGRQKFFKKISMQELPVILYESPHRISKTMKEILEICGDRYVNIGRELTKIHEEMFRGKISEALNYFVGEKMRGEFIIIISL
ncbi:16S rRNA (cytidine(1402)-2'-O)-methyltransferase [Candidatus Giovannonibacteria bacterium]|nr:16S rRNA (cytidine(1402)-2'-O)-methyltransferase [Candidatus Giovannonibacteria bacterium]